MLVSVVICTGLVMRDDAQPCARSSVLHGCGMWQMKEENEMELHLLVVNVKLWLCVN